MGYREKFVVEAGAKVQLSKIDPRFTGTHESHEAATPEIEKHVDRMGTLQYLLYADMPTEISLCWSFCKLWTPAARTASYATCSKR